MEIKSHYNEVLEGLFSHSFLLNRVYLEFKLSFLSFPELHYVFKYIFTGLEKDYQRELKIIREQYPSEPPLISENPTILHWHDAISLFQQAGEKVKF